MKIYFQERDLLSKSFTNLFNDNEDMNVQFNPLTNTTLYETGWFIQQLVMFWADNFTDTDLLMMTQSYLV